MKLEEICQGAVITGLSPEGPATVIATVPVGVDALTVYYKGPDGVPAERMLFRSDEARLSATQTGRPWSFQADGAEFKLATEATRIKLAHLFDPMMAVHTSNVEPLPHQISAVYEDMLPRQPLRFVLADDPGAGKTIMAGLLIRELIMRSDAQRILIVAPGSLVGQWQDELREKFTLDFEQFSRERQESCASGNYFLEQDRLLVRLDQLARNSDYREKLSHTYWDLIIVDEAHKLSASYFGGDVKKTQRFELGEQLGGLCRHLLLMTATPHNGKDEDFQLFLSLLDSDRFYGKFREGAHKVDVSDMMRRMVKEKLLRFDGTRLFPERRAYTATYALSPAEEALYAGVTDYVRNEMDRADHIGGKRKGTVGFALTMLQRRLASSPEAIYQSLRRRHKRLEAKLEEMRLVAQGRRVREEAELYVSQLLDLPDNLDEIEDELNPSEYEAYADQVVDQATASATIPELEAEIFSLQALEAQARQVVESRSDSKWAELSKLLHDEPEMRDEAGHQRKLIIFTEHRDTLNYLKSRISDMLGNADAVVTIHGGTNRDERRKVQELFRQDKAVRVLIATDAAGEGVNLQVANLMVNYDLPWNPNRIEQRFGRIHRIGQREVCHLWNLVAANTREGEVFQTLFDKLEVAREALGGQVFDILGEAFENRSLKELLIEAIRYGNLPETRARQHQVIDGALDTSHLKAVLERNALVDNPLSIESLYAIKEEMDKAEARKLQPHFIHAFFEAAFQRYGGELRPRESGRFEIPHVPAVIRERDRQMAETRTPVLRTYTRVCFDKRYIHADGRPTADLVHPAHPLMAALLDLVMEDFRNVARQGAVLVDPVDEGTEPRLLLQIDHSIDEGSGPQARTLSRRLQFVSVTPAGDVTFAGWAPHLDLEPLEPADHTLVQPLLQQGWLDAGLEQRALAYASTQVVPAHYDEVRERQERHIERVEKAVHERLVKEINYLTHRAIQLQSEVRAGKQPKMQPDQLNRRAEELSARLDARKKELAAMRHIVAKPPVVLGGALVIPAGLLARLRGEPAVSSVDAAARARIEQLAMKAVIAAEEALGHSVKDVAAEKCGWDVTARLPLVENELRDDRLIEVKGRAKGATTVTVTRNEILCALNKPHQFLLAIVLVDEAGNTEGPFYLKHPFDQEPGWAVTSVNLNLGALLERATSIEHTLHS
ncbi:MAG: DUF3883 domain-containing protein [Xanthomonadaceae bacterium]|nr:DUF3883 domain-containing protein [Xanthomonadaceae bacterium]